nr:MAG TPA: hypothetical protein [Bacteriophage sp.]DAO98625.1 MAG TPA: hypothetical protein [Herelleviridae sp.]
MLIIISLNPAQFNVCDLLVNNLFRKRDENSAFLCFIYIFAYINQLKII